jgi:WD40 repeat protein
MRSREVPGSLFKKGDRQAFRDFPAGSVFIGFIVAVALWIAGDLDLQRHLSSTFRSAGESPPPPATVCVKYVDWLADRQGLFSLVRGVPDALGTLAVHDPALESTTPVRTDTRGPISAVALAPDGRHAVVGTCRGELQWIDLESLATTALVKSLPPTGDTATAVAEDGLLVAGGSTTGSILLYNRANHISRVLTPGRQSSISDLRFSRGQLLSAQNNGQISLWDAASGELLREFAGHHGPATAVALLPDGKRIVSSGLDDTIRLWDVGSGRELWRGEFALNGIQTLAVSADGATAAWGGYNRRVIVWDLDRGEKKHDIATPSSVIFHLSFSPDGSLLAAAGMEARIRLYDTQTAAERLSFEAVIGRASSAARSCGGRATRRETAKCTP